MSDRIDDQSEAQLDAHKAIVTYTINVSTIK